MKIETIVELIVIGVYTFFTIAVYFYQAKRYSALEKSLSSLNDILDSVTKYKDIFKPDDIINRLTTKHEIEKQTFETQLKKDWNEKLTEQKLTWSKETSDKMAGIFFEMNNKVFAQFAEVVKHPINFIINDKDMASDKQLRDAFIKGNFPVNSESFIEMCDALLKIQKDAAKS